MTYKCSQATSVRFSRLIMTLFIAFYTIFTTLEALYVVLFLSFTTIIFGNNKNFTSYFVSFLAKFKLNNFIDVSPRYERSFTINRSMELFEEFLRSFVVGLVIFLDMQGYASSASVIAFLMMILMMISTFFGFCMSGIFYILFRKLFGIK